MSNQMIRNARALLHEITDVIPEGTSEEDAVDLISSEARLTGSEALDLMRAVAAISDVADQKQKRNDRFFRALMFCNTDDAIEQAQGDLSRTPNALHAELGALVTAFGEPEMIESGERRVAWFINFNDGETAVVSDFNDHDLDLEQIGTWRVCTAATDFEQRFAEALEDAQN